MSACRFCGNGNNTCSVMERRPRDNAHLGCTREPGHPGDHVACGIHEHPMLTWPQAPRLLRPVHEETGEGSPT